MFRIIPFLLLLSLSSSAPSLFQTDEVRQLLATREKELSSTDIPKPSQRPVVNLKDFSGAAELYVDGTNGKDTNPGTQSAPFQTLVKARNTIRGYSSLPSGGVIVYIRAGNYYFVDSSGPFTLNGSDSGTSSAPIVYTAYQSEKVQLLGGITIPSWTPYKNNIVQTNVKNLGITDYGKLASGGLGDCANNKLELFYNGEPMILARYPNIASNGIWQFDQIQKVIDANTAFTYNGTRASGWTNAPDLWLHGYWSFDWADSYVRVASIDTSSSTFHIDPSTPPVYGFVAQARYYAVNLLEELDVEKEYYLDRNTGILYFIPPASSPGKESYISLSQNVMVLNGVSNVQIIGLTMSYTRTTALTATNVANLLITKCDFSNNGNNGVRLTGSSSSLTNSVFLNEGCGGVSFGGGDQKNLIAGNLLIDNNQFKNFSRWKRTYVPAISWSGMGNKVTHNLISNAPHSGILGLGNDYLFEYNVLQDLVQEADDTGAWYTGRSWAQIGGTLRYNVFRNIRVITPTYLGAPSVQAVYLDDQMSDYQIYNNSFINCYAGSFIGGGRSNLIHNNCYQACNTSCHVDDRGLNWQNASCAPGGQFEQELISFNYQNPPWSTHYPQLPNIMNDHACVPCYNNIYNNTYDGTGNFLDVTEAQLQSWYSDASNNLPSTPTCPTSYSG